MEGVGHAVRGGDPEVWRGQRVQCAQQLCLAETVRDESAGHLARRVDPAVGAAGGRDHTRLVATQVAQQRRKLTLHCAPVALDLPAAEIPAFVVQDELDSPVTRVVLYMRHAREDTGAEGRMSSDADLRNDMPDLSHGGVPVGHWLGTMAGDASRTRPSDW